jgi:SMI1-KNR4 cell-wall
MVLNVENSGPSITEHDLARLEGSLGRQLSAPYRRFLLGHNGGAPDPVCVDVPGFGETDVQVFFGIGRSIETSRIEWNIDALKERLEGVLVPIACDSGGNLFCLSLRPPDLLRPWGRVRGLRQGSAIVSGGGGLRSVPWQAAGILRASPRLGARYLWTTVPWSFVARP